jgi:hypothetical protein
VNIETVTTKKENVNTMAISGATPRANSRRKRDEEELARLEKEREERFKLLSQENKEEVSSEDGTDELEEGETESVDVGTDDGDSEVESTEDSTESVEEPAEPTKTSNEPDHDWKKRYKDLQREYTRVNQELKEKEKAEEKKAVSKVSEDDVKNWMEKYPAVSAIVQKLAEDIAVNSSKDLREQMAKLNETRQEVLLQKAESEISKAHPDFAELRESDAFHSWVEKKPKWVAQALYEDIDDVDNIIDILSWYKSSTSYKPKSVKKTDSSKDAARSVEPKGQNSSTKPKVSQKKWDFTLSQINKMSLKEFAEKEAAIDEARKAGRILDDRAAAMVG